MSATEPVTTLAGRYRLLARVGEGGMGVVWRAHDRTLERTVAIKLLRPIVASDSQQRRRFAREARTLAGLANEHIVRIFDFIDDEEQPFLVMEYVDGRSLADTTFSHLPLDVGEAAWHLAPVAEALAYAHARGVVHRDLTPANILIEHGTGRVLTTDFGLARIARSGGSLTTVGMLVGTPEYWSPEQALGRETGTASDLYSLGCILFLLTGGRLPFEGDDRLAVGLRRAHEEAPSLTTLARGVPLAAAALVDSLLAADPGARPDAQAAAASLRRLAVAPAGDLPTLPIRPRPAEGSAPTWPVHEATTVRSRGTRPSRRLLLLACFVAAAAAVLGGAVTKRLLAGGQPSVPAVVSLSPAGARSLILRSLPQATVSVRWVYSTRVAPGRVISQRPAPRAKVGRRVAVALTVSKGTPYANVPVIAVGVPATTARATLTRNGFRTRFRYTPSWTVRKGTVIELRPAAGVRLRRPATVRVLLASGYPRAVVPPVVGSDVSTARSDLEAKHLRYQIVYRLVPNGPVNQVIGQSPSAGAVVYRGTRIRLTVARTYRWVSLFRWSGADRFRSNPFTVPARWRIRYRLEPATSFAPTLAELTWSPDGEPSADRGFIATDSGTHSYVVPDGVGTYRLAVNPVAGTTWSVEVDAFE